MSFDRDSFKPNSGAELADGIMLALSETASTWLNENAQANRGYLIAIGEAITQTRLNLAAGRIDRTEAESLMSIHRTAMRAFLAGLKYETYELRQVILDTVSTVLAYAVRNLTGINLAPHLIK